MWGIHITYSNFFEVFNQMKIIIDVLEYDNRVIHTLRTHLLQVILLRLDQYFYFFGLRATHVVELKEKRSVYNNRQFN
jgi:hypothetical protein